MGIIFVVFGITVVLVFALAGLSKMNAAGSTAASLREFGIPEPLSRRVAPAMPVAELAIAALMLIPTVAWIGAALATFVLTLFAAVVGVTLLQGKRPACNCFDQVRATPISWRTALRNVVFALMAGFTLWAGQGRLDNGLLLETAALVGRLSWTAIALLFLIALVCLQSWVLMNNVKQQGRLLLRIDNIDHRLSASGIPGTDQLMPARTLTTGAVAPRFTGTSLAGAPVSLQTLLDEGKTVSLVFVTPECAPCTHLLSELAAARASGLPTDRLLVITSGSREANMSKLGFVNANEALRQVDFEVNELFGIMATPSAVRISHDGLIASPVAVGRDAIMELFKNSRATTQDPSFWQASALPEFANISEIRRGQ